MADGLRRLAEAIWLGLSASWEPYEPGTAAPLVSEVPFSIAWDERAEEPRA